MLEDRNDGRAQARPSAVADAERLGAGDLVLLDLAARLAAEDGYDLAAALALGGGGVAADPAGAFRGLAARLRRLAFFADEAADVIGGAG